MTKNAGIEAMALLISGNPGETDETIQETIDLIKELECKSGGGIMRCFPKTKLSESMGITDDFWLTTP